MSRIEFDDWVMKIADIVKERSTCVSAQVGAVIVKDKHIISTGYNGAASGAEHCIDNGFCLRRKMGFKHGEGYEFCKAGHAESSAIDKCAKYGISCNSATIYVTEFPCIFCMIRIINSGIKKVIYKGNYMIDQSLKLAKESGIELVKYKEGENE